MTTINQRIDKAIAEQGSDAHNTPSGPLLTLLTEFAREGKMTEIAEAFCRFRAAPRQRRPRPRKFDSGESHQRHDHRQRRRSRRSTGCKRPIVTGPRTSSRRSKALRRSRLRFKPSARSCLRHLLQLRSPTKGFSVCHALRGDALRDRHSALGSAGQCRHLPDRVGDSVFGKERSVIPPEAPFAMRPRRRRCRRGQFAGHVDDVGDVDRRRRSRSPRLSPCRRETGCRATSRRIGHQLTGFVVAAAIAAIAAFVVRPRRGQVAVIVQIGPRSFIAD